MNDLTSAEIVDTKKLFYQLVKKDYKKLFLWIFVSLLWTIASIAFLPHVIIESELGFLIFLSPWFLHAALLVGLYGQIREAFWKQLSLKYNWEYQSFKDTSEEKSLLFQIGHSRIVHHGIQGTYNNLPFHIFEYEYTRGSGKSKRTYSFTVFEVKFAGTFPHLYLNYKSDWYSNTPSMFSSLARISVPSEFADKFKLYAPKEYEIETLEIFTPNIFAFLLDSKWNHDMEFINGELVIYNDEKFTNFTSLDAELNKIKKFIDTLSPLLNRLRLTQIGDISPPLGK